MDSVVTDPPYGISFAGAGWDYDVPPVDVWREVLRVLKPGGHLVSFSGSRTYHRMAVNIEDAGFEVRDQILWLYGTGFPKSRDVAKTLDARKFQRDQVYAVTRWVRESRDAAGLKNKDIDAAFGFSGMAGHWTTDKSQPSVPTLEQIPQLLEVLGQTLDQVPDDIRQLIWTLNGNKGEPGPNFAKREVIGTKYGTDTKKSRIALTVDAQDGATERKEFEISKAFSPEAQAWEGWGTALKPCHEPIVLARKPLGRRDGQPVTVGGNCLLHGTGALNIDGTRWGDDDRWPTNVTHDGGQEVLDLLPGKAARFFYCPKASKADRNDGVDGRNTHPTVKPTELMAWLIRLTTAPGGLVLDPFMGSGSTGKAAAENGFRFLGCELDGNYVEIAKQRIEHVGNPGAT
ncbi:MAG: DNA-methyltransferase [Synechococcus sp.]